MIRFVDIVARTLPRSRLKQIALAMLLSDEEEYLLLERCAGLKTIEQCDRVSPRRQREIMPILNTKMQLWILEELDKENGFLKEREQKALLTALERLRKRRPKDNPT